MKRETCPKCGGSGRFNDRPCRLCEGAGTVDSDTADEFDKRLLKGDEHE